MSWSGLRGPEGEDPDARPEGKAPAPLGQLVGAIAGRRGWAKRLEGARVHERWGDIAGEQLAAHTAPVRLHGGVLVLRVASAAWATQVRYLTGELMTRANEVLGEEQVTSVQVVIGPVDGDDHA